jgi:hypothetical protein
MYGDSHHRQSIFAQQQVFKVLPRPPNPTDLPAAQMICCTNHRIAHYNLLLCFDSYGVTDIVRLFYYQFQKLSIQHKNVFG